MYSESGDRALKWGTPGPNGAQDLQKVRPALARVVGIVTSF